MDFLDELDHAFDNILADSGVEEPILANEAHQEAEDGDLLQLKADLAAEKLKPIAAFRKLLSKAPRRVSLPALAGAVRHLESLEHGDDKLNQASQLSHLLRTNKGQLRKKLSSSQLAEIQNLLSNLAPDEDEDAARDVWQLLESLGKLDRGMVYTLFESGLWRASSLRQAPAEEVVHITHLDLSVVHQLKSDLGR